MKSNCIKFRVCVVLLVFAASAAAQTELSGRVSAVIDGKTFVLETASGPVTASIQFIDVPESGQPLSPLVRQHLEKLIGGKTVRFLPTGFAPHALVGKAFLGDIDLGQQLVRDGAAWHLPRERSGQGVDEDSTYSEHQKLARAERRGVWSIVGLTPSWEFRALKDRSAGQSEANLFLRAGESRTTRNYSPARIDADMWAEVGGEAFVQLNPLGMLFWGYDPERKIRNTSTQSLALTLTDGKKPLEVEVRVIYFQGEPQPRAVTSGFVVSVLATSPVANFAADTSLKLIAGGVEIPIGKGERFWREEASFIQEMMQYRIGRVELRKLAQAGKLSVRLGQFSGTAAEPFLERVKELIETVS